jgi:regulator of nucleoside diphosphate kinase
MRDRPIVISEPDARRLRGLLEARMGSNHDQEHLQELNAELERALVVEPGEVPANVITMSSYIKVTDLTSGQQRELFLVFPADADVACLRISVLAPLGTALLGYREGDEIEWVMPVGRRRYRIDHVSQASSEQMHRADRAINPRAWGAA